MNKSIIKVMVIDDSALIRKLLVELLSEDPNIEVVGTASDPFMARERIKMLNPDVLTLDVEMPRMDGLTFLRNLMKLRPMPVVMISSLTDSGADITLNALSLGAVDFVTKPKIDVAHTLSDYGEEIRAKVKMAAGARLRLPAEMIDVPEKLSADIVLPPISKTKHFRTTDQIIAIGASTGGTEAIRDVLVNLPADAPGIVITQHIPEAFSRPFAERMNRAAVLQVKEAEDGDMILPGHAYIAPGGKHLMVIRDGARYRCRLTVDEPVNRHRPSVDVLFRSVAQNAGPNAVGVLLTGMGDDGAQGMKEMHDSGASTICQDEKTSVVWGMPGSAVKLGCVDTVQPLHKIAAACMSFAHKNDVTKTKSVALHKIK